MSEWSITFSDGGNPPYVILKNVPAGATEAAVRKEISQQPAYKGRPISSAVDTSKSTNNPGPVTNKPPAETKPQVKPAETKPQVKPAETKPQVKPAEVKPAPPDSVINDIVTQREKEAADAKKAAAEAEKKARETKDAKDRQEALDAQREARIAQEKAERARKEAKDKQDTLDAKEKLEKNKPAEVKPTPAEVKPEVKPTPAEVKPEVKPTPAEVKPEVKPTPAEVKPDEPQGPSLWDKIKQGAKDVGDAIGGALTPSNTPGTGSATEPVTKPAPAPTPAEQRSNIEKMLDELDKSTDLEVRKRAQAARAKLNGPPGAAPGSGSGAKVQPTGPNPGGGGNSDINNTTGPAKDKPGNNSGNNTTVPGQGTNPQGTTSGPAGPGNGQQGAPGAGTVPGKVPGVTPNNVPGDVDGDKIRKQRREQEAKLKQLQQLPDKTGTTSGGWRDAGMGARIWRGGPGEDPQGKWKGYVFSDGDIMPAGDYSTGVGNSRTTTYSGNAGTDQFDRQGVDKLLYDRERRAQEIERLQKQKGVKEDFDRILKLAGLNK